MRTLLPRVALGVAVSAVIAAPMPAAADTAALGKINHIVVIYQENWSFDSLYGNFPGAKGWSDAGTIKQVDLSGQPLASVPQPLDNNSKPDTRFPATLPVTPLDLTKYVPTDSSTGDIVHRYYQQQVQIDGGKNDRYVAVSDNGGLVLSYYDATDMPEGRLAKQYVLADNFFHSAFGGSFLNHQWLICACTPQWPTATAPVPEAKRTVLDANKLPAKGKDGFITAAPDNFIINTAFTVNKPHPAANDATPALQAQLVPNLTGKTIGDALTEKGVSWKWYSGGWDAALAGTPDKDFQFHHQPFAFYQQFADGTQAKKDHLQDEAQFMSDLDKGTLPAVSFIKPLGPNNEHPGYANLIQGQQHVALLVAQLKNSQYWKDSLIVITYDENGGRYDHVAPPVEDKWGPGARVPGIIISPYAKHAVVDHTQYETVSILSTIEHRFGLQALGTRDAAAKDFSPALTLDSASSGDPSGPNLAIVVAVVAAVLVVIGAVMVSARRRA
jgi:acid phosphatase